MKYVIIVLVFAFAVGCSSPQLQKENIKLKNELGSTQNRLNELELYVNNLKDQISNKDQLLKNEIKRVEDQHNELEKILKNEIKKGEIEINNIKGVLTLNMADRLFFDSGKADLKDEGKELLHRIGDVLKAIPDKMIRVEGHTDNVPIAKSYQHRFSSNWDLGAARSVTVVRFYTEKIGIDPSRISAVSFGEYRPIASNETEEGKARNRRIEIVLINKQLYQLIEMKQGLDDK